MKLRIVSDLHFEFCADGGEGLASEITGNGSGDFDVLVVAGDLASAGVLVHSVHALAVRTSKPIVYVVGNHEFYGSNWEQVTKDLRELSRIHRHLHLLNHESETIEGVRFLGTPLWFRKSDAPTWQMNDFTAIERFANWVYVENDLALRFLNEELSAEDVVVTHYLPAERSIHPVYKGSPLNAFFLCDVEELIRSRQPALWIHGHTHRSVRYRIGETEVVCNPFGYSMHEENREFDPFFTVEIPR